MTILNLDGDIRASLSSTSGEPIVLQNVSVTGELRGALFDAQVRQTFINPTKKHLEVIYSFPLPWGAELLGVEVQLNDATLYGTVVEKSHALQGYEHSLAQGDAAIMLERGHDGHYVLNLGNLAPGERCVIALRYGQLLRFEQGGLRLKIPTVIAPRYGDVQRDGGLEPHQVPQTDFCRVRFLARTELVWGTRAGPRGLTKSCTECRAHAGNSVLRSLPQGRTGPRQRTRSRLHSGGGSTGPAIGRKRGERLCSPRQVRRDRELLYRYERA